MTAMFLVLTKSRNEIIVHFYKKAAIPRPMKPVRLLIDLSSDAAVSSAAVLRRT